MKKLIFIFFLLFVSCGDTSTSVSVDTDQQQGDDSHDTDNCNICNTSQDCADLGCFDSDKTEESTEENSL